jgi:dipeptidyl aminopeptidase/acylaminoacyl peptidase
MKDGRHILWISERDDWRHLYMIDTSDGSIRQLTKGQWNVREIQFIDENDGFILFYANGFNASKGEDPYNKHLLRLDLNSGKVKDLTPENGHHEIIMNSRHTAFVDNWSRPDQPYKSVVRRTSDGTVILKLQESDASALLESGYTMPEVFHAKGRDGKTDIWGIIQRPSNFDPSKKYPIIEYIYSGPGDQYVPKTFQVTNSLTALAELGFIVVQMDGMSTSWRSKDFEEVCYKNLKDAGFPDRILWIKAAAAKYPYMDLDRVGIYGCSAGGQESLAALLFHGDFYKAAYSACGCHDNRMDKIWWNEQWMGYPLDESYIASSNTEHIANLKGKLMLLVGELDDNVDPSSTFQVVNQLIKHNKDFEFIYLPGERHTMGGTYGTHKMYDFFVKNFLGVEPPAWSELERR